MKLPNHAVKYTLAVLLLATLTTTQILSVVYSKYTTGTEIISDSARVAKYDVTVTEVDKDGKTIDRESNIYLDCANDEQKDTITKYYKITNNSEVAVSVYRMQLWHAGTTVAKLPGECNLTVTDGNGKSYAAQDVKKKEGSYIGYKNFKPEYPLSPGESLTMTLKITMTNGADKTSIFNTPMRVRFTFNQID